MSNESLSNEFIHSEVLAETYVEEVREIRALLEQGNVDKGLLLLEELEQAMPVTLAWNECDDGEHIFH